MNLKSNYFYLPFIVLIITISSCSKNEYVDITDDCEFREIFEDNCFWGNPYRDTNWLVFFDKEEFNTFAETKRMDYENKDCENVELPRVNFLGYTLIGSYTERGGGTYLERKVFKNSETKTIIYQIDINIDESSFHDAILLTSWNWVLIPWLKTNYSFEFVIVDNTKLE